MDSVIQKGPRVLLTCCCIECHCCCIECHCGSNCAAPMECLLLECPNPQSTCLSFHTTAGPIQLNNNLHFSTAWSPPYSTDPITNTPLQTGPRPSGKLLHACDQ
jgi:hypothetical protein